jgi:hypothetical protein
MNRVRIVFAATVVVGAGLAAGAAFAQTAAGSQAPLQPILAGKKIVSPLRGEAEVEFTEKKPTREKGLVVQEIEVKNVSKQPIARLTIDETWYDKAGAVVGGGKGAINGLLQPNEIQTVKIEMPFNANVNSNKYNFSHANGTVKPRRVAKLSEGESTTTDKEPAAKPAAKRGKK